jgi:hypothetical protein
LREAGLLYRLRRYGVPTPDLLAFGQHHQAPGYTHSFHLTSEAVGAVALGHWWAAAGPGPRRRVLRATTLTLRRIHDCGCVVSSPAQTLAVREATAGSPEVLVSDPGGLRAARRLDDARRKRDLYSLLASFPGSLSASDVSRFVLAYFGHRRLTPDARRLVARVLRRRRP